MTNIRESFKELLAEAIKVLTPEEKAAAAAAKVKAAAAKVKLRTQRRRALSQHRKELESGEEGVTAGGLPISSEGEEVQPEAETPPVQPEKSGQEDNEEQEKIVSELPSDIRSYIKFYLADTGLVRELSDCLKQNFDPENEKYFDAALDDLVKFCVDFKKSCKQKTDVGIIKTSLKKFIQASQQGDLEMEDLKTPVTKKKENEKKTKPTEALDIGSRILLYYFKLGSGPAEIKIVPSDLKKELQNFYIACNIIHYYAYGRYYNIWKTGVDNSTRGPSLEGILKRLFTGDEDLVKWDSNYLSSYRFKQLHSISDPSLRGFLNSGTPFADYVKKYLGTGLVSEARQSIFDDSSLTPLLEAEDSFKQGFTEDFIEIITSWYLFYYLVGEESVEKLPNLVVRNTLDEMDLGTSESRQKLDQFTEYEDHVYDEEGLDTYNVLLTAENQAKYETTAAALRSIFATESGANNLSLVLAQVLVKLPESKFAGCTYYKLDRKGGLVYTNILSELKQKTSGTETESNSAIVAMADLVSFSQDRESFTTTAIKKMVAKLPKDMKQGYATFGYNNNQKEEINTSISSVINNPEGAQINTWYTELSGELPFFMSGISPKLDSKIDMSYFSPGSAISKTFGLRLNPDQIDVEVSSEKIDLSSPVARQEIERAFDTYVRTVSQILQPPAGTPIENVGILIPTHPVVGKHQNPFAVKRYIAYPRIDENTGKDITATLLEKDKKKVFAVYKSEGDFNAAAEKVVSTLLRLKPKFLAVKSVSDLELLLTEVCSNIDEKILAFRSPKTITYTLDGKTPETQLGWLISPKQGDTGAIASELSGIQAANPLAANTGPRSPRVNIFMTFARNQIKFNLLQESIKYKASKLLLEAVPVPAEREQKSLSGEKIQLAIVNLHLRAQVLYAVASLYVEAASLLEVLNALLKGLDGEVRVALQLSTKFTAFVITKLTNTMAAIFSHSNNTGYKEIIDETMGDIKAAFNKSDKLGEAVKARIEKARKSPNRFNIFDGGGRID